LSDLVMRAPVLTAEQAGELACLLKKQGKRIVFTNGCFDLLHPGHLEILQKAREMGDWLVVGLNSDNSVKRLKGATRPVQNLESRAAVLSCLRFVDCVVPFSEDTPLLLIEMILPDVLVKGGDYSASMIVGADAVIRNGGRVETVALIRGHSTTAIIGKKL
jgi:rfaE bifunctional protein nucleotidyltransferase chain/domain